MRFNHGLELEDEFETNYYFRAPWHQNEYEDSLNGFLNYFLKESKSDINF